MDKGQEENLAAYARDMKEYMRIKFKAEGETDEELEKRFKEFDEKLEYVRRAP